MIHYVTPAYFDFTVHEYLSRWGAALRDRLRILHYEDLRSRRELPPGTYVLSALDQLGTAMRRLLQELRRQLDSAPGFRFLNHPALTLRRFELLTELRRLGCNEFGAVRATGNLSGLRYPVFLRSAQFHEGAISPLLHSDAEVRAWIGRAVLTGHRANDLLAVEFCDTADEAGYYRKYSAFNVGGRVLARSLQHGRRWMLKHEGTEFSVPMALEEQRYVSENPHASSLAEIFRITRVDYGRIDYALREGRIQTWEINLHPTIGRGRTPSKVPIPDDVDAIRHETKERFYSAFESAWRAVDVEIVDASPVRVALDGALARAALAEEMTGRRGHEFRRRLLRPIEPLVKPVLRHLLPSLGRLVRFAQKARGDVSAPDARSAP